MSNNDANEPVRLTDEEVGEKFGCAAGPNAPCGNYLACARIKEALASVFNVKSGAGSSDTPSGAQQENTYSHNGKMG